MKGCTVGAELVLSLPTTAIKPGRVTAFLCLAYSYRQNWVMSIFVYRNVEDIGKIADLYISQFDIKYSVNLGWRNIFWDHIY